MDALCKSVAHVLLVLIMECTSFEICPMAAEAKSEATNQDCLEEASLCNVWTKGSTNDLNRGLLC